MSLKRILALASGASGDELALTFAAYLASQHDGCVDVLPVYPDAAIDFVAFGMTLGAPLSSQAIEDLAAAERELQGRIEKAARRAANDADVVFGSGSGAPRLSVLTRSLSPGWALSRETPLTDLVVVGQPSLESAPVRDVFAQALLSDRAPVLIARGAAERLGGAVAIAWDGGAQAGRAVRAALPLMAMASRTYILRCVADADPAVSDPEGEALKTYLHRHGLGEAERVLIEGRDVGAGLLDAAESKGAGLLVAGGWGHSRMRETIFGGATRSFLRRSDGPSLLLAH